MAVATAATCVPDLAQVEVNDLSVHYLGRQSWVLHEVSFTHLAGEVTAVIGPSGCGKTTLVRALCGLVPHCIPSEYRGEILIEGHEVADAPVQFLASTIAYVGQNPDAAVVTRTVRDDVAFALQNLCLAPDEIERRVTDALGAVGLADSAWADPWTLSGGQRQRLSIAVALAMRPQLLVLDEPTSTIDTAGRDEFYAAVEGLVAAGSGVVVIDHDLDPILPFCTQVIAIGTDGSVIAAGTPAEVFLGHAEALAASGVWLPRALRARPASEPQALTCADAAIRLPRLDDVCTSEVRYLHRTEQGWADVAVIDTAGAGVPATVDLESFQAPGRSPAISLRLGGGELVALIGGNGAGKSSLLGGLAGLTATTATRAFVGAQQVRKGRHHVGYVFQNPEHQMVASSVAAEVAVSGADSERVDSLLRQFHLGDHRDHHPMTLSGGQARRLSVATMVAEQRDVIVLDEPTYGQDWANTCELMAFIDELRAEGRSVIMATHDLELALAHCSHVVALPTPTPVARFSEPDTVEPAARPGRRRSLFSALNPLTVLFAVAPTAVMLFALQNATLNLAVLIAATIGMVAARAERMRTCISVAAPWLLTALLNLVFRYNYDFDKATSLYDFGDSTTAATSVGALVALLLLSGISGSPEALISTLTTSFKLPYRIGSAGTAAAAFVTRFTHDFRRLRSARALRGVGRRWGPLAPVARWMGSIVPLTILAVQQASGWRCGWSRGASAPSRCAPNSRRLRGEASTGSSSWRSGPSPLPSGGGSRERWSLFNSTLINATWTGASCGYFCEDADPASAGGDDRFGVPDRTGRGGLAGAICCTATDGCDLARRERPARVGRTTVGVGRGGGGGTRPGAGALPRGCGHHAHR